MGETGPLEQRGADLGYKHKPLALARLAMTAECVNGEGAELDGVPRPGRLRRTDLEVTIFAHKIAGYLEHAAVEVNVPPLQGEELAAAHPGRQREHVQGFQGIVARGTQQTSCFVSSQRGHLAVTAAGRADQRGHIPVHTTLLRSVLQHRVQDGVNMANGHRRRTVRTERRVHALEVSRLEARNTQPSERRSREGEMVTVRLDGGLSQDADARGQPLVHESGDGHPLVCYGQTLCGESLNRGEFANDLGA